MTLRHLMISIIYWHVSYQNVLQTKILQPKAWLKSALLRTLHARMNWCLYCCIVNLWWWTFAILFITAISQCYDIRYLMISIIYWHVSYQNVLRKEILPPKAWLKSKLFRTLSTKMDWCLYSCIVNLWQWTFAILFLTAIFQCYDIRYLIISIIYRHVSYQNVSQKKILLPKAWLKSKQWRTLSTKMDWCPSMMNTKVFLHQRWTFSRMEPML